MSVGQLALQDHPRHRQQVEQLYRHHHGWLHGWLRGKLGDACTAADLAHDTFLRLLSKPEPPALHTPRAYLATVARGLVINHWRRQEIERACLHTLSITAEGDQAPSPEARAQLVDALCALDALLDQLHPKARSAFLLAQLDGLSYAAIAQRLQVSERMVKKYMAQAMLHCLQAQAAAEPGHHATA